MFVLAVDCLYRFVVFSTVMVLHGSPVNLNQIQSNRVCLGTGSSISFS